MPSPFPGMNPYLEQEDAWQDFHQRFITVVAEVLFAQVKPNYMVKIEESLYIHELPGEERRLLGRSDVSLTHAPLAQRPAGRTLTAPTFAWVSVGVDVERHSYIEVRDRQSRQLVTVLELLSPSNKKNGADRAQYTQKRGQLLRSPVHLVEIDLLRGGPRMPIEDLPECDYCVLVSRAEERPKVELWPIRLRDPLPEVPVPLTASDPDARLDLQAILHRLYDAAGYELYVYTTMPQPPLSAEDAAWAAQFVPAPWSRQPGPE